MLAAPRYLGLASLVNDGPAQWRCSSSLGYLSWPEVRGGWPTDPLISNAPSLPPLVSCPAAPFSLSLSLSLPRFPPPSRNSLENLSGGTDAAKINPKRAQKKSDPPPVFANFLDLSDLLHIFLPFHPSWNGTILAQRPIRSFFALSLSLQHARYHASADSKRLFEFSLRFPP